MARPKKNIARLVLQGISVLGILFGLAWFVGGVATLVWMPREDVASLCFGLVLSALFSVLGAWFARDCYLMLRGKLLPPVKSISVLLALAFWGGMDSLLGVLGTPFAGEERFVGGFIGFAAGLPAFLSAVIFYSLCTRLLNGLRHAAYGPAEPSDTRQPTRECGKPQEDSRRPI